MILEVSIELTTNYLGGGPRKNGVRTLRRSADNRLAINEKEWKEDLKTAAKELKIKVDIESISLEPGLDFPEVNVLRRVYNKTNVDLFEGVSAGNSLSFCMRVDEDVNGSPTVEEISKLFAVVGKFIGISQFGKKFHCGRFKVTSVNILGEEDFNVCKDILV